MIKACAVAILAICLVLAGVSPASADPVSLVVGAIASAFKLGALATTLLSMGLSAAFAIGSSLLQKKLAKKNQQRQRESGIVLDVRMGDDQPVSFVIGKYAASGVRKYIGVSPETRAFSDYVKSGGNAFGAFVRFNRNDETPNALVTDVIELGWLPSRAGPRGIQSLWINEELCNIDWNNPHPDGRGYPVDKFRDDKTKKPHLWVRYLDGTQAVADPYLAHTFSGGDHPYLPSMIGRGCQALILTAKFNRDIFTSIPTAIVEPAPLPLYDLRKDSTNGGNGPHRWGVETTYEASTNPAVMIYNIIRGIYYEGEWVYGGQNLAAFRLPASSWIAAANECDRLIDVDGKPEPQYRAGLAIACDRQPLEIIEELEEACNGRLAEVGGIFKLLVGAPGAAVYSFTDDNVVVTRGQSFKPFPALSETHNAIEATYPEPAERWAIKDAPARYDEALEAADGERRLATGLEFLAVPFASQVQRLMKAVLKDNRRFRTHGICLPPDAWALEPNDVVSWTSLRNGYVNKKFLVTRIDGERSFLQSVSLREIDPSDYSWFSRDYQPVSTGWLGRIDVPVQTMKGWQVEPATVYDDLGRQRRPAIRVSCTPDLDDIARVRVQIRTRGGGDVIFDSDSTPYSEPYSWIINANLPANTWLQARGRFVPGSNRPTEWSDWLDVRTPDVLLNGLDLYLPGMVDELNELNEEYNTWVSEGVRDLIDTARQTALLTIEQDAAQFTDKMQLRREVVATRKDITASYTETIEAAVGPNSAFAQKFEQMQASLNGVDASVSSKIEAAVGPGSALSRRLDDIGAVVAGAGANAVTLLQTQVGQFEGAIKASSDAVTALSASVGRFSADGRFRMTVEATPAGSRSRIGFSVAASAGDVTSTAAMYLDALANGDSQVLINANRFAILVNNNLQFPFVVDASGVRMNVAHIGKVLAGSININNRFLVGEDGTVVIRNSLMGQRVEMTNSVIQVFDANNVLRVRLGMW